MVPFQFLVCALFYGDYPLLAQRCARSLRLLRDTGLVDMRIGLNEVSPASLEAIAAELPGVECISARPQLYKYPMMHKLVHGYTGAATHLMWFDDDSCLAEGLDAARWLEQVGQRARMTGGTAGSLYYSRLTPPQREWFQAQPWTTGRPLDEEAVFNLGAWFMAPLELLRRFDWPPANLRHNGGDMALGVLCQQHGLPVLDCQGGVAIDAGATLAERTAPRRGYSEPSLGLPA